MHPVVRIVLMFVSPGDKSHPSPPQDSPVVLILGPQTWPEIIEGGLAGTS